MLEPNTAAVVAQYGKLATGSGLAHNAGEGARLRSWFAVVGEAVPSLPVAHWVRRAAHLSVLSTDIPAISA